MSAGLILSAQAKGRRDCPYLCGPLGGSGIGATIAAAQSATPRVYVGAEAAWGAVLEGPQQIRVTGGSLDVTARHRDVIFSGVVRVSPTSSQGAIQTAIVGGLGIARRKTSRAGVRRELTISGPRATLFDEELTDYLPAVTIGVDGAVRIQNRVSLVPLLRLHYVFDADDAGGGPPKRGVSSILLQGGVMAQFRF